MPPDGELNAWLPFETEDEDGTNTENDGLGSFFITADAVPSTVFASESAEGYDLLTYFADPDDPESAQRLSVKLAFPKGTAALTLNELTVGDLDAGRELLILGRNGAGTVGRYSPCNRPIQTDTYTFELEQGTVVFHTRPAVWGTTDGFAVRAEGEISGESISVDRYWDLGYSSGDMGSGGLYNALPSMFVRTQSDNSSHCVLVLEQAMDGSGDFVARWLDCEGDTTDELSVVSSSFTEGNGTTEPIQL